MLSTRAVFRSSLAPDPIQLRMTDILRPGWLPALLVGRKRLPKHQALLGTATFTLRAMSSVKARMSKMASYPLRDSLNPSFPSFDPWQVPVLQPSLVTTG